MSKNVSIIINPAAGLDAPVLALINRVLWNSGMQVEYKITQKTEDAYKFTLESITQGTDIVAACGGDGTVMEVAQALVGQPASLAVIPAGSANILARELNIPIDIASATALLVSKDSQIKVIDVGKIDGCRPFLVRINIGILGDMIAKTDRDTKDRLGKFAYALSALKDLGKTNNSIYTMNLDGKQVAEEGASLMVTNAGNIGMAGVSLLPDIDIADGFLDVILIKSTDFTSLVSLAGGMLTQNKPDVLRRWRIKQATIAVEPRQTIVYDDEVIDVDNLNISVIPKSLRVLVPSENFSR